MSDDEVYGRLVSWVSERTGHPSDTIKAVLDAEAAFWADRPNLVETLLDDE
jgi:hypothetical protein